MELDKLTLGEIKSLQNIFKCEAENNHPYRIGENYFIRTVTHFYTGKLEQVFKHELVMSSVSWIADTGRFADFIETGKLNECEPMKSEQVIIGRGAIIDCCLWKNKLPTEQK
jgi:hypothetical protein